MNYPALFLSIAFTLSCPCKSCHESSPFLGFWCRPFHRRSLLLHRRLLLHSGTPWGRSRPLKGRSRRSPTVRRNRPGADVVVDVLSSETSTSMGFLKSGTGFVKSGTGFVSLLSPETSTSTSTFTCTPTSTSTFRRWNFCNCLVGKSFR